MDTDPLRTLCPISWFIYLIDHIIGEIHDFSVIPHNFFWNDKES
jgi:hypothetical protein